MTDRRLILPFVLPVASFAAAILAGAALLWWDRSAAGGGGSISFMDAFFTATSSVCVTGLATVDPSTVFNRFGQSVMIVLMQLGGLGITTYSTLVFYMWTRRISIADRLTLGQSLLTDSSFHLFYFIRRIVVTITVLELCGALALYMMEPGRIGAFNSLFLAVSAFCNAGFAPWPDNLIMWRDHLGVNMVVMLLIVAGGLGFAVLDECLRISRHRLSVARAVLMRKKRPPRGPSFSYPARVVIKTSLFLIFFGAGMFFITEYFVNGDDFFNAPEVILPAFFQSVTSRTAGFATVNIARLTDLALLVLISLMFIGGSSGSCAGGIKTGTFRVLAGFAWSTLRGRSQVTVMGRGVSPQVLNKAFVLFTFSIAVTSLGTFALTFTEGGANVHSHTPFQVLDLFFEVVSAFATVGLSAGVTPELSGPGKAVVCLMMFLGRVGPIWLITTIQRFQSDVAYRLPDADLPVG